MNIDWATIASATWRVAAAGLILGAGLPVLFAIAVRLQAVGAGEAAGDSNQDVRRSPIATGAAYAVFAVIALIVMYAVLFITAKSLHHYFGFDLPGYSS